MSVMGSTVCETSRRWDATAFFAERRQSPRFEPGEQRLWMGWWAADQEFRVMGVILRNISRTGAAMSLTGGPEPGRDVWLRIEGAHEVGCVAGRVVGVEELEAGHNLVRIEFPRACPDVFFEAAVVAG